MLDAVVEQVHSLVPAASFVGSATSLGVTGYFWLVKMNRERPQIHVEAVEYSSYIDLGDATDDVRCLCFRLGLVVVNNSTLPNAVLSADVHVKPNKGENYLRVSRVRPIKGTNLPVNLPALQSGSLILEWEMEFPYLTQVEESYNPADIVAGYLNNNWDMPEHVTVELKGVRGKSFTHLVPLLGSRMTATVRQHLEMCER